MSETKVTIFARDLFTSNENIATINGALKLRGSYKSDKNYILLWYDNFMREKRIEPCKIDNAITWSQYMTDEYVREYKGHHFMDQAEVPYLPFDNSVGELSNKIVKSRPGNGKFPKFKLESAIEDRRDENGDIVIRYEHKPVRIFQTARPWRHPSATGPVPKLLQLQQRNGWRNIDRDYTGSLDTRSLESRPHVKRDLKPFMINEDKLGFKTVGIVKPTEYWW
jgi:hypothetical protein